MATKVQKHQNKTWIQHDPHSPIQRTMKIHRYRMLAHTSTCAHPQTKIFV